MRWVRLQTRLRMLGYNMYLKVCSKSQSKWEKKYSFLKILPKKLLLWKFIHVFIEVCKIPTDKYPDWSLLIDDSLTPLPLEKCLFSNIDFLDVSDDFMQKKNKWT